MSQAQLTATSTDGGGGSNSNSTFSVVAHAAAAAPFNSPFLSPPDEFPAPASTVSTVQRWVRVTWHNIKRTLLRFFFFISFDLLLVVLTAPDKPKFKVGIFSVVTVTGLGAVSRSRSNQVYVLPWDDKPFETLPSGKKAYLDEQDVVTFLDPPKDLIPLDPASYNPAAYLWSVTAFPCFTQDDGICWLIMWSTIGFILNEAVHCLCYDYGLIDKTWKFTIF